MTLGAAKIKREPSFMHLLLELGLQTRLVLLSETVLFILSSFTLNVLFGSYNNVYFATLKPPS